MKERKFFDDFTCFELTKNFCLVKVVLILTLTLPHLLFTTFRLQRKD